jgi:hypothetical protein
VRLRRSCPEPPDDGGWKREVEMLIARIDARYVTVYGDDVTGWRWVVTSGEGRVVAGCPEGVIGAPKHATYAEAFATGETCALTHRKVTTRVLPDDE